MDRRTYSHRDYGGQICIYIDNFDLHIFQSKIDFVIFEKKYVLNSPSSLVTFFAYQWLDIVKIN